MSYNTFKKKSLSQNDQKRKNLNWNFTVLKAKKFYAKNMTNGGNFINKTKIWKIEEKLLEYEIKQDENELSDFTKKCVWRKLTKWKIYESKV